MNGETLEVIQDFHMWVIFAMTAVVVVLYITELLPLELTSMGLLGTLLVFFHIFPMETALGENVLDATRLLQGFANPALITVIALLIVGEGMVQTGALDKIARAAAHPRMSAWAAMAMMLGAVLVLSAFLNNTPIVVIFIPILRVLAQRFGQSSSRVMIPLSYAAILGGTTTLIGSSTNLLVSGQLVQMGHEKLGFFEFSGLALMLAAIGFVYVLYVLPRILPDRESLSNRIAEHGKQYVSQIVVPEDSELVGHAPVAGFFKALPDVTVRMILRGEEAFLPPYDDYEVRAGDLFITAATRKALTDAATRYPGLFHPPSRWGRDEGRARMEGQEDTGLENKTGDSEQVLVEVMVTPSSRLTGLNLLQVGFRRRFRGVVLGIQRRARMIQGRMTEIRLESGDVMLIQTNSPDASLLRASRDLVVLSGSVSALLKTHHARRSILIFLASIGAAATGIIPIVMAALLAATLMIASGVLNLRQASRAIDHKVVMIVAAAISLGAALQETGGAAYVAHGLITAFGGSSPGVLMSMLFILVALFTNVLSNNACAVLFTPIALNLAAEANVDPRLFAITVLLAANCSFASPVGYQTNLLVMGPGQYQFSDFVRGGLPLVFIIWIAFSLLAPWYWGL